MPKRPPACLKHFRVPDPDIENGGMKQTLSRFARQLIVVKMLPFQTAFFRELV